MTPERPTEEQYRAALAQCVDVMVRMRIEALRRWAASKDNPYLDALKEAPQITRAVS